MSTTDMQPIVEQVCVEYAPRVTGWREPTDTEWAEIEAFSSGVPGEIGDPLDPSTWLAPPGVPLQLMPGPIITANPPVEASPVDVPAAFWLFAAALVAALAIKKGA